MNNEECKMHVTESVVIKQKPLSNIVTLSNGQLRGLSNVIIKSQLAKWNARYTPLILIKSTATYCTVLEILL